LKLPAFFPDATYATIHSLPFHEIKDIVPGFVVTTLHFHLLGIERLLQSTGGFKNFSHLPDETVLLSDSGGFQVLSLINRRGLGKIKDEGAQFIDPDTKKKVLLTPELSQEIQKNIQSDIRTVLDVPLMGDEDEKTTRDALEQTTKWAKRAKESYLKLEELSESDFVNTKPLLVEDSITFSRPLLNAVVQGGNSVDLRKESAEQLSAVGFDLFGFGGWPVDSEGKLQTDILEAFVEHTPSDSIRYGMGIGTPDDIATCYKIGITLFDCVIPSRNARHGTLYVTKGNGEKAGHTFDTIHIRNSRYQFDQQPLDTDCNCPTCRNYSRSYLRFLWKHKNPVAYSLLTLHNIWWYQNFILELSR